MLLDARAFERLRGQRRRRAAQDERQAGADADAVQAAREEIAARTATCIDATSVHLVRYPS